MTATDELRRMLDERGVEWRRTPHYSSESMDNETVFCGIGIEWLAGDHLNGRLGLRALKYEVTPEQAVEATLGRGTCHPVASDNLNESEGTGDAWADCSECGHLLCVLTDPSSQFCWLHGTVRCEDTLDRLADLIDPTCHNASHVEPQLKTAGPFVCSHCGCWAPERWVMDDFESRHTTPISYCPSCGARVVES